MRCIFCLTVLFSVLTANAQLGRYSAYTTDNGLPGNHVHRCVEDDKGFLWVATEAGIARFDGKYFQVFTTQHGLPDNEVLQVVKDVDGTIWVNCFKYNPSYFDEVQNRFINATENPDLAKVSATTITNLSVLPGGGVMYTNEKGSHIFRNRRLVMSVPKMIAKVNADGSVISWQRSRHPTRNSYYMSLLHSANGTDIDSVILNDTVLPIIASLSVDEKLYIAARGPTCYVFSEFRTHPLRLRIDTIRIPGTFFSIGVTNRYFYVLTDSAQIYVYDKNTLQLRYRISGDFLPNSFYEDSKGNVWVSTIDRGLLVYRKEHFAQVELPPAYKRTNFISIARKPDGNLFAGNFYGEVVDVIGNRTRVHTIVGKIPSRQRKIMLTGKDIYTVSEDGVYLNYSRPVKNLLMPAFPLSGKTGLVMNDSTIIIGTGSGLHLLNTRNGRERERFRYKRITAMVRANDSILYLGSTDGLYTFNYHTSRFTPLAPRHRLFSEKVMALSVTTDGLLWVATSGKGVILVKNGQVIANITSANGIVTDACRSIAAGKHGQLWMGSSQGISIIRYTEKNGYLGFDVQNISVNDGLVDNEINEMIYSNDTMFIATANGISLVPSVVLQQRFTIPVHLTRIRINQRDTVIAARYQLSYRQQNIQMQFAGIELNGHLRNFQYLLDNSNRWTDLTGNTLTLQLSNGNHSLYVRALDVNGNTSEKTLMLRFEIDTPFWKTFWFWTVIALLAQMGLIYFISRSQKKKKEAKLAKQIAGVQTAALEQQAFTSLMSPHFMFNAMNSIQHYINVQDRQSANRYLSDFASLMRKSFEAAQRSFIPLEQELENLRIYLRLEQMRFAERFSYEINLDDNLDPDEWMIPTMMLQPLLENALLHGIMPSTVKGLLVIDIKTTSNALTITITDNGIGIQNSRALKMHSGHTSHGMELIRKRIAALARFTSRPIRFETAPVYNDPHNPGNRVTVVLPAGLYESWMAAQVHN